MNKMTNLYGAKAEIYISFQGDLAELSKKLEEKLHIEMSVEYDKYPPYEKVADAEVLGFEIYMEYKENNKFPEFNYVFVMETTTTFGKALFDKVYDLSIWLAQLIAIYDLKTLAIEGDYAAIFYRDMKTLKIVEEVIAL